MWVVHTRADLVDGLAVASNMRPHIHVEAMMVGAVVPTIHSLSRPVRW
jgi:hypothetical protein